MRKDTKGEKEARRRERKTSKIQRMCGKWERDAWNSNLSSGYLTAISLFYHILLYPSSFTSSSFSSSSFFLSSRYSIIINKNRQENKRKNKFRLFRTRFDDSLLSPFHSQLTIPSLNSLPLMSSFLIMFLRFLIPSFEKKALDIYPLLF